jgi:hypothetical protein
MKEDDVMFILGYGIPWALFYWMWTRLDEVNKEKDKKIQEVQKELREAYRTIERLEEQIELLEEHNELRNEILDQKIT